MEANQYDVENKTNEANRTLVLTDNGIKLLAFWIRLVIDSQTEEKFNPLKVLETIIPKYDQSFNYKIIDYDEWTQKDSIHSYYSPYNNTIYIRSDTYNAAANEQPMALITIAHEICHWAQAFLKKLLTALKLVEFKTTLCLENSVQREQHEIQTDSITDLLLFPDKLIEGKTDNQIFQEFYIKPVKTILLGLIKKDGPKFFKELKALQFIERAIQQAS